MTRARTNRWTVLAAGPGATVQDLGRPGMAHLGVGTSGAADRPSHRLANRLVGNPETAATLEVLLGGLRLRSENAATVAVAGAACGIRAGDRAVDLNAAFPLPAGAELALGVPSRGLRTYVAVRGGIAVDPILGSRSTDTLAGIGPEPLRAGSVLPIGPATPAQPVPGVDVAPVASGPDVPELRVLPGPRHDWFVPGALRALCGAPYVVGPDTDRVGAALEGPLLSRRTDDELPSEAMVTGALQVPPSGRPILMLADHPVTGGYPVLGVVRSADLPYAAQARPGDRLRFRIEG